MPTRPLDLLVVEDSPTEKARLEAWLAEGTPAHRVRVAATAAEAREAVADAYPDCLVLDQFLPDGLGTELLAELHRRHERTSFAVVLLTGSGDELTAVEAMKLGAQDYLRKEDITSHHLERAIRGAVRRVELERRIAEDTARLVRRNAELETLRDRLEAANARLGAMRRESADLQTMVLHDIRQPMTVLLGGLRELEELPTSDPTTRDQLVSVMRRSVGRLQELTEEIGELALTGPALRRSPEDLTELCGHVVEELRHRVDRGGKRIELDARAEVWASVDRTRITRLLSNLVANGLRYAEDAVTCCCRSRTTAPAFPRRCMSASSSAGRATRRAPTGAWASASPSCARSPRPTVAPSAPPPAPAAAPASRSGSRERSPPDPVVLPSSRRRTRASGGHPRSEVDDRGVPRGLCAHPLVEAVGVLPAAEPGARRHGRRRAGGDAEAHRLVNTEPAREPED